MANTKGSWIFLLTRHKFKEEGWLKLDVLIHSLLAQTKTHRL
jgi:hypothetical protein